MKVLTFTKNYINWMSKEYRGKQSTKAIYDDLAAQKYEELVGYDTRVSQFKKAFSHIKGTKKILDLACGTGAVIDALPNIKNAIITGTDISPKMLNVAKKRFKFYSNITFKEQDFFNGLFKKNSFDLITIAHATRFIPKNQEKKFGENISNWLKEDGEFIAILHDAFYQKFLFTKLTGYPKGYNIDMDFSNYFIDTMKPYFKLEKRVWLGKKFGVINTVALSFKKVDSDPSNSEDMQAKITN